MKALLDPMIEAKIQELSRRLGDHRKKYGSGCHPPREIWDKAIALCEQAPLVRVAEGVGVSPNGLRNRKKTEGCPVKKGTESRQPQFLEVRSLETISLPPPTIPSRVPLSRAESSRQVELQRSDGSCLRITDLSAHGLNLGALIEGFMASKSFPMGGEFE
jgi:hypothetical protein